MVINVKGMLLHLTSLAHSLHSSAPALLPWSYKRLTFFFFFFEKPSLVFIQGLSSWSFLTYSDIITRECPGRS